MRICVFGAGAIGGHIAARLATGGADTSVVARGPHLAAIRADGLRVHAPDREMHVHPAASDDPRDLGPQDAVIVTAKAPALPSVAAAIAPLLGPATAVAFVMNGIPWWYFHAHGGPHDGRRMPVLDPDDALRHAVTPERTIGGVVYSACEVVAPGIVEVESARSRVIFGEPDGSVSPRAEAIAGALRAGGMGSEATPRIRDAIWSKLLGNITTGPLSILTQSAVRDFGSDPVCVAALRATYAEGQAVAAALGCAVPDNLDPLLRQIATMTHKPSILQDLERGRPMEVDAIYTSVLDLAGLAGVAMPTFDMLVALTRLRARAVGLYGGVTAISEPYVV